MCVCVCWAALEALEGPQWESPASILDYAEAQPESTPSVVFSREVEPLCSFSARTTSSNLDRGTAVLFVRKNFPVNI